MAIQKQKYLKKDLLAFILSLATVVLQQGVDCSGDFGFSGLSQKSESRFLQENLCSSTCVAPPWQQYIQSLSSKWELTATSSRDGPITKSSDSLIKEIEAVQGNYQTCLQTNCGDKISKEEQENMIVIQSNQFLSFNSWLGNIVSAESIIIKCYQDIESVIYHAKGAMNFLDRNRKDHLKWHLEQYDLSLKEVCDCELKLKSKNQELKLQTTKLSQQDESQSDITVSISPLSDWNTQAELFPQYCSILSKRRESILRRVNN